MDLKILRLASDTKHQKKLIDFTHNSKAKNPLCGDEIQLFGSKLCYFSSIPHATQPLSHSY